MPVHTTLSPIEATTKAVDALLAATPTVGAGIAFRAAIGRHGRSLFAEAGQEGLAAVLARIRAEAPDQAAADEREAIVRLAWNGLIEDAAA